MRNIELLHNSNNIPTRGNLSPDKSVGNSRDRNIWMSIGGKRHVRVHVYIRVYIYTRVILLYIEVRKGG